MKETKTEYMRKDRHGKITKVTYIKRSCGCDCAEDEIQVNDVGGPYKAQIPRGEIGWAIKGLLDGYYEVETVNE